MKKNYEHKNNDNKLIDIEKKELQKKIKLKLINHNKFLELYF